MEITTWCYPWDLGRLGPSTVCRELAALGLVGLDMAATYHPITSFSPRGADPSVFFSAEGGVFFPARIERYSDLQPQPCPAAEVVAAWDATAASAAAEGLELNAWIIALFQPWLAQAHPEVARVLPTGEPIDAGVCSNNPRVHTFLAELVGDLCDQWPITNVKLEGVSPPRFDYGWTRPKVLTPVGAAQRQLWALCFCSACRRSGAEQGIDVDGVRRRALAILGSPEGEPPPPGASVTELSELVAYGEVAQRGSRTLVERLVQAAGGLGAGVFLSSPREPGGPGLPASEVADRLAGITLIGHELGGDDVAATVAAVHAARASRAEHRPLLEYAFHPPTPLMGSPSAAADGGAAAWMEMPATARALGAERVSIYNYGLHRQDRFAELVDIVREA